MIEVLNIIQRAFKFKSLLKLQTEYTYKMKIKIRLK